MLRRLITVTPLVVPVAVFVVWEIAVQFALVPRSITAAPTEIAWKFIQMVQDGSIFRHIAASMRRLLVGFFIGSGLGLTLGLAIAVSSKLYRLLMLMISLVAPIPITAWIPVLIILFGIEEFTKVAVICIGAFFPIFFATLHGVRSTDSGLLEIARVYEKPTVVRVWSIILPSAAPSIFIGLRSALGLCWILIVVSEVIASKDGLGWLMWDARNFARPDEMFVAILLTGALGALSAWALNTSERYIVFWRREYEGEGRILRPLAAPGS